MQYVKGYFNKECGPFIAKERFEGAVSKVFDKGDHYVIQGVKFPKEQIDVVAPCSLLKETLDMPALTGMVVRRKPRAKKPVAVDEFKVKYDRIKANFEEALKETIKLAKNRKRIIDYTVLDILKEKERFLDVTLAYAIKDDDKHVKMQCLEQLQSLYVNTIDTIENSKTPGQQKREILAAVAAFCNA